jgi:DNA-directed RNA polymerase
MNEMSTTTVSVEEDLMSTQIRLEEEMTERGAMRYFRDTSKAREIGREDGSAYGQAIIKGRLETLSKAIQTWMDEAGKGSAGNNNTSFRKIKGMSSDLLAFLTLKNVLAGVSSVRTLQFVAVAVGTAVEDELRFAAIRVKERNEYEKILKGVKKRTAYQYKHIYAVRIADQLDDWVKWSRVERLHVGVKLIELCMNSVGIIEILNSEDRLSKYVRALPDTIQWIEKKNNVTAYLRPVYEPMVVRPRSWTTPFDGGYISSSIKPLKLVKTKNKAYLDELRHMDMPIVYEAVNALQNTAWQINTQVFDVMNQLWTAGSELGGLPKRDALELPKLPEDIDQDEDVRKEYRRESHKVHMKNLSLMGQRIAMNITLEIAERYNTFKRIYMPYQLDFRGRIYAVPHLNPQGSDYQKALLRFANGKPLGPEGWKWLAIHGANVAGYDKASLEDRVNWVLDNEEEIIKCADNPFDNRGWCTEISGVSIDKPWQFLAFCFEWLGFVQHGESFVSKLPVAMDGSCSGIQHFSAMLRDKVGGQAVNLVPQDLPADVYQLVANKVIEQAELDSKTGTKDTLKHNADSKPYVKYGTQRMAEQWLKFGINRKVTKRSVMTLAYGSKQFGFKEQLMEDILEPARHSDKEFPFDGDGYQAAVYMAGLIWDAVNKVLVKAGEAMRWLQSSAQLAASEELPVRWSTPVGFPVMQAYPDYDEERIKTALNGYIIKLTMKKELQKLDKRKQGQGIAPNFVHACDGAHMQLTVVRAKQAGLYNFAMIHDSFGTTAGDVEELYRVVRESFVEMYEEIDVLGSFKEELEDQLSDEAKNRLQPLPERGDLELDAVCDSRYCFA